MPPIPVQAEPLHVLQARYPRCLEYIYDSEKIDTAGAIRPGEVAAQVFDLEDGLRFIISRQRVDEMTEDYRLTGQKTVILHVSASVSHGSALLRKLQADSRRLPAIRAVHKWLETVPERFRELSGNDGVLEFLGFDGCVGHWMQEE